MKVRKLSLTLRRLNWNRGDKDTTTLYNNLCLLRADPSSEFPTHSRRDASFAVAAEVVQTRCMSCHDSETRVGEIDLTPLLQQDHSTYGKYTKLWVKLESKVARGEMPPSDEEPLTLTEKEAITSWFEASFVLREGKPHIGTVSYTHLTLPTIYSV